MSSCIYDEEKRELVKIFLQALAHELHHIEMWFVLCSRSKRFKTNQTLIYQRKYKNDQI
jgi:hypothetical protein